MRFVGNAPIFSADFRELGRISRFVLHPTQKRLTHLVIQRGVIFPNNYVLPLEMIDRAASKGILLRVDAGDAPDLLPFEETVHVPIDYLRYENTPEFVAEGLRDYHLAPESRYIKDTKWNIPNDALALKGTARVTGEDHHPVAHVNTLHVDAKTHYITHIMITHGLLTKARRRIPAFWCRFIAEDEVYIPVGTAALKQLLDESTPQIHRVM
jgi:hypothetical protein